jgi:hypothetical protein
MKRIICVFLFGVIAVRGDCFADSWTINAIAYDIGRRATVAVDINNKPIVASESYPQNLVLIRQIPEGYEVNSIPQTSNGSYPKLKVTSNNELALSFLKSGQLWYGSKSDWFDWIFSQVQSSYVTIFDVALTANDIPHIAYNYQNWIYHAFYDVHSQQWVKEQLTGFGNHTFAAISIDIDLDDRIMISCSEGGNVQTAVYSDGFWNHLPSLSGYRADCSFTADNLPAVAFERSSQIIYAVHINEVIGWAETSVATFMSRAYCSLAHSSTGIPGIAYIDDGALMYATNVAGGWTTIQIDEKGNYSELIFDHNDKPLIVYNSYDYCLDMPVLKLAGIGLEGFNIADLNNDKVVNFKDFAVTAEYWMAQSTPPDFLTGDLNKDGFVNNEDLRWLSCNWLWQGSEN